MFVTLIIGFVQCFDGTCPQAASSGLVVNAEVASISLFLILRAFASGSTALTGVEAIANGVQAFREPKALRGQDPRDHGRHLDNHVPRDLHPGDLYNVRVTEDPPRVRHRPVADRPDRIRWRFPDSGFCRW